MYSAKAPAPKRSEGSTGMVPKTAVPGLSLYGFFGPTCAMKPEKSISGIAEWRTMEGMLFMRLVYADERATYETRTTTLEPVAGGGVGCAGLNLSLAECPSAHGWRDCGHFGLNELLKM